MVVVVVVVVVVVFVVSSGLPNSGSASEDAPQAVQMPHLLPKPPAGL